MVKLVSGIERSDPSLTYNTLGIRRDDNKSGGCGEGGRQQEEQE